MPDRARRASQRPSFYTPHTRDARGDGSEITEALVAVSSFSPVRIDKCPSVRNVRSAAARHKLKLPRLFAHLLACARRLAHLTYHQPSLVHTPPNFPFLPRLRSAHFSIASTSNAPELYLNRTCPKPKQNQKTSSMAQSRIHCGSAAVLAALPPAPHIRLI